MNSACETLRLVQTVFVVKIRRTITQSCALQLLKEGFWSMIHERNPKFEFLHDCFEKFKPKWQGMCKHRLACHCAPLCQIWGHLNNARWINSPQVANCGWGTWSTHIVPKLRYCIGRARLFLQVYYFYRQYLTHRCHKWKFEKILSYFELVMNFESFGQTMVDQSLWIAYETLRSV